MFSSQPIPLRDDDLYYQDNNLISPTSALFPPELSEPYNNNHLTVPNMQSRPISIQQQQQQQSVDYSTMTLNGNHQQYHSRVPSLSPASSGNPTLSHGHSPHSSASPSSNFSSSGNATDDFLLSNSFSSNEIDMLLFQNDYQSDYSQSNQGLTGKPGQTLFIPGHRNMGSFGSDISSLGFTSNNSAPNTGISMNNNNNNNNNQFIQNGSPYQDDAFDLSNYVDATGRRYSTISSQSDYPTSANVSSTFTQQQWVNPNQTQQFSMGMNQFQPQQPQTFMSNNGQYQQTTMQPMQPLQPIQQTQIPIRRSAQSKPAPIQTQSQTTATRIVKPLRVPSTAQPAHNEPTGPPVGKHNKTERRYRQKVQAAQTDLRDAVPALRVLYGTSTEEQKQTTDIRAPDGTVDGLGEVTRPNASAKATVLIGARMYIELLQRRVSKLQRKVDELEQFRSAFAGQDNLEQWSEEFERQEKENELALPVKAEVDVSDDEDDEEEMVVPKKRGRTSKDSGVRVFAAFAMSFSLLPSASNLFTSTPIPSDTTYDIPSSSAQVISRLPLITAEHSSRLLQRVLPAAVVPSPSSLVDWGWRLIVALVLVVLLGPVIRWSKRETVVGRPGSIVKDSLKLVTSRWIRWKQGSAIAWNELAASVLGGALNPSRLVKLHILLHINRTASDAYSFALLALLQPESPLLQDPKSIWHQAQSHITPTTSSTLKSVLSLPYDEAIRSLDLLPVTTNPISGIAEQITLVHLNDLYSQLFVRLVNASTSTPSSTLKTLLHNLEAKNLGKSFQATSFDKEIKGVLSDVEKGSTAHSLGLVLIGLWGLFIGPSPAAQAALISTLAAAEMQGPPLSSVSGMLELLYPGSSQPQQPTSLNGRDTIPENGKTIDKLALVIIGYINLLLSSAAVNSAESRLQRLEASVKVQKATGNLRLGLTQVRFVGLAHDEIEFEDEEEEGAEGERLEGGEEERGFEHAKERLVGVLSVLGRRAAGRAAGRDEDSGLEGDVEEL